MTTLFSMAAAAATVLFAAASCNGPAVPDATHPADPSAPADPAAGEAGQAEAFTDFGLRLFQQVRSEEGARNVFISPASVALALAMTHEGAAGETRASLARTLTGGGEPETARAAAALAAALRGGADVRLNAANSIWARDGVPFRSEFLGAVRDRFDAEVATLDFADAAAPARINAWVSQHTEGRIPSMLDRIDPLEVMFLVNAVYFKGQWGEPFDPRVTRSAEFTLPDGERISVPTMNRTGQIESHRGDGWEAVRLPYGEAGRFAMYVFLPEEGRSLDDFFRGLTAENWASWMAGFQPDRLALSLPRFKIEYEIGLRPALGALGMEVAFDPARADFGGMLPRDFLERNNAYVTRVQHKTFVEVNEEGTEAAAATSVGIGIVSMPPQFTVDRPFFVAIRDDHSGALLFAGQVMDPRG